MEKVGENPVDSGSPRRLVLAVDGGGQRS